MLDLYTDLFSYSSGLLSQTSPRPSLTMIQIYSLPTRLSIMLAPLRQSYPFSWTDQKSRLDLNYQISAPSLVGFHLVRRVTPLVTQRKFVSLTIASQDRIPSWWRKRQRLLPRMTIVSISSVLYHTRIHYMSSMVCKLVPFPMVNVPRILGSPLHANKSSKEFRTMLAMRFASICWQLSVTKSISLKKRKLVYLLCSSGSLRS